MLQRADVDRCIRVVDVNPLELVKLPELMSRTSGSPVVKIGLIDGPVASGHPDLMRERLRDLPSGQAAACDRADSSACLHGPFVPESSPHAARLLPPPFVPTVRS
jgi:hypothetical protein